MHMPSREKYIFHMLFRAFQNTPRKCIPSCRKEFSKLLRGSLILVPRWPKLRHLTRDIPGYLTNSLPKRLCWFGLKKIRFPVTFWNTTVLGLTLIGKSWKTHPENFLKYSFSGSSHRTFYWKTHPFDFFDWNHIFGLDEFSSKTVCVTPQNWKKLNRYSWF